MKYPNYNLNTYQLFEILRRQWDEGIRQRRQTIELVETLKKILVEKQEYVMEKEELNAHVFEERVRRYQRELAQVQKNYDDFPHPTFFVQAGKLYSFERDVDITKHTFPEAYSALFALQVSSYRRKPSRIKAFLNYQQQVSFQNNAEHFYHFLQELLHEQTAILYYDAVVDAIDAVKDRLEGTQAVALAQEKVRKGEAKQPVAASTTIHLQVNIFDAVLDKLNPFFSEEDQAKLYQLLKGEPLSEKLHFLSQQNTLVIAFRQLQENNFIAESKAYLKRWLCEHFTYKNIRTTEQKELAQSVVHQILCNHPDRQVKKESRIDLSDIVKNKVSTGSLK